jgi:catechol 2,3-dioxygenase-like lactoylglutathione lyase family enzyme
VPLADRIDHIVLTVVDIEASARFYERALKLERERFAAPTASSVTRSRSAGRRSTCRTEAP